MLGTTLLVRIRSECLFFLLPNYFFLLLGQSCGMALSSMFGSDDQDEDGSGSDGEKEDEGSEGGEGGA